MPRIFLKKKITTPLGEGFPWIFEGDIGEAEGQIAAGEMVPVFTHNGSFVGSGFYSPASKIKVRLISRQRHEIIDAAWWVRQLQSCWQLRQRLGLTENCRLVYGEGDGLPGLIVDKLGAYLLVQILTAGLEAQLPKIAGALQEVLQPIGIYLRNDTAARLAEGLDLTSGFLSPPFDPSIPVRISGLDFGVDLSSCPQSNFYLDTRLAESALLPMVKGATLLAPYSRTGVFELLAAANGAASVQGIAEDHNRLAAIKANAERNGVAARVSITAGNTFDCLKKWAQEGKTFDLIFLDPPNLARSKSNLPAAMNAWRELNLRAMQLSSGGGFMVTTLRSHLFPLLEFQDLLQSCARSAGRRLRILQTGGLPPDFPRLPFLPQGDYFRFVLAEIS